MGGVFVNISNIMILHNIKIFLVFII